jgi:hypothetical protein
MIYTYDFKGKHPAAVCIPHMALQVEREGAVEKKVVQHEGEFKDEETKLPGVFRTAMLLDTGAISEITLSTVQKQEMKAALGDFSPHPLTCRVGPLSAIKDGTLSSFSHHCQPDVGEIELARLEPAQLLKFGTRNSNTMSLKFLQGRGCVTIDPGHNSRKRITQFFSNDSGSVAGDFYEVYSTDVRFSSSPGQPEFTAEFRHEGCVPSISAVAIDINDGEEVPLGSVWDTGASYCVSPMIEGLVAKGEKWHGMKSGVLHELRLPTEQGHTLKLLNLPVVKDDEFVLGAPVISLFKTVFDMRGAKGKLGLTRLDSGAWTAST